jgi:ChrR Cupin-like domain
LTRTVILIVAAQLIEVGSLDSERTPPHQWSIDPVPGRCSYFAICNLDRRSEGK